MLFFKIDKAPDSQESLEKEHSEEPADVQHLAPGAGSATGAGLDLRESRSTPMLLDLNQMKELEIIEEQNEQDNQSDSGECSSLLQDEAEAGKSVQKPK